MRYLRPPSYDAVVSHAPLVVIRWSPLQQLTIKVDRIIATDSRVVGIKKFIARRELKGLDVLDDTANKVYPLALDIAGRDNCAVGRIRMDCALDNGLAFWVVGDQLLKGAALNAVQIAECLV